ncbi:MAG: M56 family metallopeptidase [Bacteroidetes bacterium]|nr:M56 family metallopeptidase [Bacteroidota bacterium]MBU1374062.1 M56 family metallopeptidase [Bacteroidota bacterium]MBU1760572.1 M56 family metallopeptidase [Bacteroidota bacterium]MBU2267714.1 M56 family metallopeptidase [Bacteroidota bacterium]MBU2375992.1 M56 family metallopeptidase [Bacteroidota bacterium]
MHQFNRFYLLGGIILSFFIPLIVLDSSTVKIPSSNIKNLVYEPIASTAGLIPAIKESNGYSINYLMVLLAVYLLITLMILIRFVWNLYNIYRRKSSNPTVLYGSSKIITLKEKISPHSFLNFIFLSNDDYHAGVIEEEILYHELTHVKQKHSYDILFIEMLIALFWFNPILYLYRKSIKLNHEYLADEAVINIYHQPIKYQYLLIEKSSGLSPKMSSNFNYSITKKRLIMMTKTKSLTKVCLKQIATIPMLAISIFLFSKAAIAQVPTLNSTNKEVPTTQEGVSKELLKEYQQIVTNHIIQNSVKKKPFIQYIDFSPEDMNRLQSIYLKMSKAQQREQTVIFVRSGSPLPKVIPTNKEMEAWKDDKTYGVWINEKRINNSDLKKYKPSDFSQMVISKLSKNAINYGKHYYQIDLMTNEYYDAYIKKTKEQKDEYFVVFSSKKKGVDF